MTPSPGLLPSTDVPATNQPLRARLPAEATRFGYFIHELRNLTNTAVLAFDVLKTGNVGVGGSTGTVLHRSLLGLNELIARSVGEMRLTQGVQTPESIAVAPFLNEIALSATCFTRWSAPPP